ncbi:hypothetical protein DFH01_26635 [Falsiroseomonas bella]|uniref:Uncharacterized protein n=1 Tax=Falsiroseomonas bella TaxID=2184016 RepID=A0A317F854_9PROT|nr:hypothetical protein [Falsiroseomonas bella]PWS34207.1 hypothetical protein DFH01_26635 [Falsiroseomonas bella]
MAAAIADILMGGAVLLMLVAMWRVLRAGTAAFRAMRAGHAGPWLIWDPLRFHDRASAPPAAQPHLDAFRAHIRRALPFIALSLALGIPAAILAG